MRNINSQWFEQGGNLFLFLSCLAMYYATEKFQNYSGFSWIEKVICMYLWFSVGIYSCHIAVFACGIVLCHFCFLKVFSCDAYTFRAI